MNGWVDRDAALQMLGVRPQTLYAYVSRGRIAMRPDPADPRRSLYRADDIQGLTTRRHRGRRVSAVAASAMAWGEPSIETTISTVLHGRPIYRGEDAVDLSAHATLEEVAKHLWQSDRPVAIPALPKESGDPFGALADLVRTSYPALGRSIERLHTDAEQAIGCLASTLGAALGTAPLHARLVQGWSVEQSYSDAIRTALVLVADHDLNASTFAVRVTASTGASIAACLLAGLAALSGPRHGGAGAGAAALLKEARQSGSEAALARYLALGQPLPGFDHPLYPQGDPRAAVLLRALPPNSLADQLCQDAVAMTGARPNIDFALAALTSAASLPQDAPFWLFALGRSIGWTAHAVEQVTAGGLIRPRGVYKGPLPG